MNNTNHKNESSSIQELQNVDANENNNNLLSDSSETSSSINVSSSSTSLSVCSSSSINTKISSSIVSQSIQTVHEIYVEKVEKNSTSKDIESSNVIADIISSQSEKTSEVPKVSFLY